MDTGNSNQAWKMVEWSLEDLVSGTGFENEISVCKHTRRGLHAVPLSWMKEGYQHKFPPDVPVYISGNLWGITSVWERKESWNLKWRKKMGFQYVWNTSMKCILTNMYWYIASKIWPSPLIVAFLRMNKCVTSFYLPLAYS